MTLIQSKQYQKAFDGVPTAVHDPRPKPASMPADTQKVLVKVKYDRSVPDFRELARFEGYYPYVVVTVVGRASERSRSLKRALTDAESRYPHRDLIIGAEFLRYE